MVGMYTWIAKNIVWLRSLEPTEIISLLNEIFQPTTNIHERTEDHYEEKLKLPKMQVVIERYFKYNFQVC